MQKKIKIVKAPPAPGSQEQNQDYPPYVRPEKFLASAETIQTIEQQISKFKALKAANQDSPYSNISISPYKQKDPQTGERKTFPQIYSFTINGRKEPSYYAGHSIKGKIYFPDNYPKQPPTLVVDFLRPGYPLRMVNLYLDGRVCHHTLDTDYYNYPKFDVPYIMKQFENMFYFPNSNDPANMELGDYFIDYPTEYWEFQRKQAEDLPLAKEE